MASSAKSVIRLPPLPSLRDLLKIYNLRAIKQMSQNFLLDEKINSKIVRAAGNLEGKFVCEVGPGPGSITRAILKKDPQILHLIELDTRFKPSLQLLQSACPGKIEITWGDVLAFNLNKIVPETARTCWSSSTLPPVHIIGNLPFQIASPLIIKWLRSMSERTDAWEFGRVPLTLTFQQEVAERIVAQEMDEPRCRLSIMCQYLTKPEFKFTIPSSAFVPKPDVDVGVVKFTPLQEPRINHPFAVVEKVTRQVFHLKNKHSWKGASTLFPMVLRKPLAMRMYETAGIRLDARSRELSVEEIGLLCSSYLEICDEYPVRDYHHQGHKADHEWEKQYGHIYGYRKNSKVLSQPSEEFDYEESELHEEETCGDASTDPGVGSDPFIFESVSARDEVSNKNRLIV